MTDQTAQSYVDQYAPPQSMPAPGIAASKPAQSPSPTQPAQSTPSQALEDQNIFQLLGVSQASDAEKEAFLDELQQVIWEDFLANDVDLLVTDEEKVGLTTIMQSQGKSDLELQEAIVVYLEKLIPDLEEIMLEKALELKGDMVKERIAGMKEFFADKPDKLQAISEAESLIASERWHDLAEMLNKISASA